MSELLDEAATWLGDNHQVAVARVVDVEGSAPLAEMIAVRSDRAAPRVRDTTGPIH